MFLKRVFDIFLSIVLIFVLLIPILIIAMAIKIETKGPAIFHSKRFGRNKILFLMPKFRSMKTNTPQVATDLLVDSEQYITKLGHFLRKSSLDELPQLWSICKGEMSFVGPRPALFNQYDLINLREKLELNLLTPGLTGWAQINGRDKLSIQQKVNIEFFYKKNQSIFLDLKIIYLTFLKVVKMKDVKH